MTKRKLTIIRIVLALTLVLSLSLAAGLTAFAEETAPQTREFNEVYDRMLYNGATDSTASSAYRAISWTAGQCDDDNDPIYKIAGPAISAGFDTLSIELRSPDGSIDIADLTFAIRISDNVPLVVNTMTGDNFVGGVSFSEGTDIGTDWSTLVIDFAQTETGIDSTTPDAMVGFHLYVTENTTAGKLDIRKVYVTKDSTETVVEGSNMWWDGGESGTFQMVAAASEITSSKQFVSDVATSNNLDEAYSAIVLGLSQVGAGTVTVAPIAEDGTVGTAKAWSELKDLNGTAVPALTGVSQNVVISLDSLGAKAIKGVQIAVDGCSVALARAFFTNLQTVVPDKYFPVFDSESITYMSKFDFEYLTAGADYDKAVTDCADFDMDYILSYSTKNNVITNGHLVLDAQGEAFTSIKLRSKVASEGRRYLVLKYKLEGRDDLTDLRFDVLSTATDAGVAGYKYPNQWFVGKQLLSTSDANPYIATGGYNYLVIDLIETFGSAEISGLDIYIGGEGKVLIDEIFYADVDKPQIIWGEEALATDFAGKELTATAEGYSYVGYIDGTPHVGAQYMSVTMEGDVSNVRFQMGGGTYWLSQNAEGTLVNSEGEFAATSGTQTFVFDLAKSGVDTSALSEIHVHNTFAADGDVLKITSVKFGAYEQTGPQIVWGEEVLADDFGGKELTATAEGYSYVGWINGSVGKDSDYMMMEVEGDISQLRMEFTNDAGGVRWIGENADGSLVGLDGNRFATSGKQTLIIDLDASGIDSSKLDGIHVHNTFAAAGDVLKITSVKFGKLDLASEITWDEEVLADDFGGKELTAAGADYAYVGWINGSLGKHERYMLLEVEGDISQLRIEFADGAGGIRWIGENAEGSLVGLDGNRFATSGKQTLIIDLDASGINVSKLGNIHIHHNFAAAGDVLKITSVKFGSIDVIPTLPASDDAKPEISATIPESGLVGTTIAISASATDNYDAEVELTIKVSLDGKDVVLTEGKFTPASAGTYTVEIIAKDDAGNEAKLTKAITVSEPHACESVCSTCGKCTDASCTEEVCVDKCPGHQAPHACESICPTCGKCTDASCTEAVCADKCPGHEPEGLKPGVIVAIVIGGIAVVAGVAVAIILIRKKKLGK